MSLLFYKAVKKSSISSNNSISIANVTEGFYRLCDTECEYESELANLYRYETTNIYNRIINPNYQPVNESFIVTALSKFFSFISGFFSFIVKIIKKIINFIKNLFTGSDDDIGGGGGGGGSSSGNSTSSSSSNSDRKYKWAYYKFLDFLKYTADMEKIIVDDGIMKILDKMREIIKDCEHDKEKLSKYNSEYEKVNNYWDIGISSLVTVHALEDNMKNDRDYNFKKIVDTSKHKIEDGTFEDALISKDEYEYVKKQAISNISIVKNLLNVAIGFYEHNEDKIDDEISFIKNSLEKNPNIANSLCIKKLFHVLNQVRKVFTSFTKDWLHNITAAYKTTKMKMSQSIKDIDPEINRINKKIDERRKEQSKSDEEIYKNIKSKKKDVRDMDQDEFNKFMSDKDSVFEL